MQLQKWQEDFRGANLRIMAMTTDSVAKNARIAKRYNLTFPILSDSDGETLKARDMWDERYKISKYGFTLIDGRLAVLGHRAGPWSPSSEVKAYFLRRVAESASEETSGG